MTLTGMEKKMTTSNNVRNIKEMKRTKSGNSYWEDTGAYQAEYDQLFDELVPTYGKAKTVNGELLRCACNLQHEYFQNGNGNTDKEDWDEPIYNRSLDDDYAYFLYFIYRTLSPEYDKIGHIVEKMEHFMLLCHSTKRYDNDKWMYSTTNQNRYAKLIDMVMHYILTHENKDLEGNYIVTAERMTGFGCGAVVHKKGDIWLDSNEYEVFEGMHDGDKFSYVLLCQNDEDGGHSQEYVKGEVTNEQLREYVKDLRGYLEDLNHEIEIMNGNYEDDDDKEDLIDESEMKILVCTYQINGWDDDEYPMEEEKYTLVRDDEYSLDEFDEE